MARSKSTSGSKTNTNKEQTSVASVPDVRGDSRGDVPANAQAIAAEIAPIQAKPDVKPEIKPEAPVMAEPRKKLEVVKATEPRRVVPINVEDEIRHRAYELYKQRGTATGSAAEDWLAAEREVRQRYRQQQSA
jgi:Protein of unknown function (DUF2934)